jgi:hypothetical protein
MLDVLHGQSSDWTDQASVESSCRGQQVLEAMVMTDGAGADDDGAHDDHG